jgi:tetratricopeptide (TPR) repeat protein
MGIEPDSLSLTGIVAFTGRLASMKRADAFALVRKQGGTPRRGVTKATRVLVVGQLGWPLLADGGPSNSLCRAKAYGVQIVSERQFLEFAGKAVADDQLRTYTADQLVSLSGLPKDVIEQLTVFGLLDARDGLYRFRDLAAARQVAELFAAGVGLSVITKSLYEIGKWLPDTGLSSVRLYPASNDAILVGQLNGRTDKKGQFVLPIEEPPDDADALFEQAQAADDAQDTETAERLYRRVMKADPDDPAAAFNLGNLLRSTGRAVEVEAAFRAAIKTDPRFVEAWFNLADLLDERSRVEDAIACLKRALSIDPEYADAIFNLALLLQRLEKFSDAMECWRHYLAKDQDSSWATRAKRALKYCEMQVQARRA